MQEGKHFQVIVVDARPQLEGQQLLRCLLRAGISCSYTLINALYYIMAEASKVRRVKWSAACVPVTHCSMAEPAIGQLC